MKVLIINEIRDEEAIKKIAESLKNSEVSIVNKKDLKEPDNAMVFEECFIEIEELKKLKCYKNNLNKVSLPNFGTKKYKNKQHQTFRQIKNKRKQK